MQYDVGVGAKRSTHTLYLANMGGGDRYLYCKRSLYPHAVDAVGTQYVVGTQYAVDVSAKRSTHTVDLANIGGGDHYL